MSAAGKLLDRLERVKQTGPGRWLARCPAHKDTSPSLSIRDADNRALLHCFAGCDVGDVLSALGLELRDLFDAPIDHRVERSQSQIPARDILEALDHEMTVAVLILDDLVKHRKLSPDQFRRLGQAAARIGGARALCCPERMLAHAA